MQRSILVLAFIASCDKGEVPVSSSEESKSAPSGDPVVTYIQKSKATEARVNLARLFDAAQMAFDEERVDRGAVAVLGGGGTLTATPHRCPNDGKSSGSVGPTPALSVKCSDGEKGQCRPMPQPSGGAAYAMSEWTDDPVWNGLAFQMEMPHYFHYAFEWENTDGEYGACKFTVRAFGDLDGDGEYSTYERSGSADKDGVTPGEIVVTKEFE